MRCCTRQRAVECDVSVAGDCRCTWLSWSARISANSLLASQPRLLLPCRAARQVTAKYGNESQFFDLDVSAQHRT